MLAFLIAVLVFAFGVGLNAQPIVTPNEIAENFENLISHVNTPPGNPVIPPQNLANQNGNSTNNDENNNGENGGGQNGNGNGQNGQPSPLPNTSLVAAYNTKSGIVIEQVAAVAVENSPSLVSCEEEQKLCENPTGPGNSQNAPVGPPDGGPEPHGGQPDNVPPQEVPPVDTPSQAENASPAIALAEAGLSQAAANRP